MSLGRVPVLALLISVSSGAFVAWVDVAQAQAPRAQPTLATSVAAESLVQPRAGGLTADDVARRATLASPSLAARRARIEAARAQVDEVTAQFFPRVTLSATYTRLSATDNSMGGALVGAQSPGLVTTGACPADLGAPDGATCLLDSQGQPLGAAGFEIASPRDSYEAAVDVSVPISDYLLSMPNALAATRAQARSSELGAAVAERDVQHEARVAYFDWLRAVAAASVTESALARTDALRRDTEAARTAGAATHADVLRVEALVSSSKLQVIQASKMRQLAAARLAILMDEPVRDYSPGQGVPVRRGESGPSGPAQPSTGDAALARLVAEALTHRLELRALDESMSSLLRAESASNAARLPRLDGFGQLSYAKPNQRYMLDADTWHPSWAVGLRLSYTISDTFAKGANSRELAAQRAELEAQRREFEHGIRLEVTRAYLEAERAALAVGVAEEAEAAAREAYRVSRELHRAGRATTTEVIAAEDDLIKASLQQVNAAISRQIAALDLDHAIGRHAG